MLPFKTQLKRTINRWIFPTRWHQLRSTVPVSSVFGLDRGKPIDRYYIEKFLHQNSPSIKGVVMEIGEDVYSKQFGTGKIAKQEILHFSKEP